MSIEQNKALDRLFIEAWDKGDTALLDKICDPSCVFYDAQPLEGIEAIKQHIMWDHQAFPDLHISIEEQIAEADRVVSIFTFTGTHLSSLGLLSATGKKVRVTGIFVGRYSQGKYAEGRSYFDRLSLMQQLGILV